MNDIVLNILFYKYEPNDGFWMKTPKLVPTLCWITALFLYLFFIRPEQICR